jgi:hypothetical protein
MLIFWLLCLVSGAGLSLHSIEIIVRQSKNEAVLFSISPVSVVSEIGIRLARCVR